MKRQTHTTYRIAALLVLCLSLTLGACQPFRQLADGFGRFTSGVGRLLPGAGPQAGEAEDDGAHAGENREACGGWHSGPGGEGGEDAPRGARPWDSVCYDPLLYPYYGQLSEDAQAVYRQACYYAGEGVAAFEPCRPLSEAEAEAIMTAVYYDQPSLFWLDGDYEYRHLNGQVVELILHFNDLSEGLREHRLAFEEAARLILEPAAPPTRPAEKKRIVHDRLLEQVVYDEDAPYNQNAYSALVQGAAVCAGYARAFQYLMLQLQIPCYYCVGAAVSYRDDPQGVVEDHAWNIVGLEGEYYNVDPTWDDTLLSARDIISYGYYNRPDEAFLADHTRSEKSAFLPDCRGQSHTYEALYGQPPELGILEALGLSDEDVIYGLEAYYDRCRGSLTENGPGESAMSLFLWGRELMDAIQDAINTGAYEEAFLEPAVESLQLNGYHFSIHIAFQELGGDCYLLEQTMTLE